MSPPALPANAAVLGAGTIGLSVGILLAAHGVPVTLVTRRTQAAAAAPVAVDRRLTELTSHGAFTSVQADAARARVTPRVGLPDDESFELIFEAVSERLDHKQAVLAGAEPSLTADGVLATTTSSLPLAELASALAVPQRFAGWHFFHPADLMALVEIVPAEHTDPGVLARLRAWSETVGRRPIVLRRDVPGFVANRLQYALLREAYALVEADVCGLADVDVAVTAGLGARWAALGPFETMDLAGLEVHAAVAAALFPLLSGTAELPAELVALRASGAGGARAGRGLLGDYPPELVRELEARRDETLIALRERAERCG
jgi:3-hydroxybutyryl-CoA dehydrogenase